VEMGVVGVEETKFLKKVLLFARMRLHYIIVNTMINKKRSF
jgi:hypothetical protein